MTQQGQYKLLNEDFRCLFMYLMATRLDHHAGGILASHTQLGNPRFHAVPNLTYVHDVTFLSQPLTHKITCATGSWCCAVKASQLARPSACCAHGFSETIPPVLLVLAPSNIEVQITPAQQTQCTTKRIVRNCFWKTEKKSLKIDIGSVCSGWDNGIAQ